MTELKKNSKAEITDLSLEIVKEKIRNEILRFNEPMSKHTTFRIGGLCDVMVLPESIDDIRDIVLLCRDEGIDLKVMGNGSNILVRDGGIRGVVVKISDNFCYISENGGVIRAQAGALLSTVAHKAMNNSLTGLEFASGIPGTVGGGVMMNAGAYDGELKDSLLYSVYMDGNGEIVRIGNEEHKFGYRSSIFSDNRFIVLESTFGLEKGVRSEIKASMADLNKRRRDKQPLAIPNAGSTFKRPKGHYAGALIEQCHLKGCRFGGASVSEKHAGFIVNDKNAMAKDVEQLMEYIIETVYNKTGVRLEPEIRIIGEG
ncbi:MAG: UDP-N-acetylmuramate dehydrogenase [Clostridia bacterium]|nr:UDP-N-acetylmuramate dehydrogenase [Clostridia bacterium]MBN2882357.1 UDP-N-acetylmuramate dehydrogenase [Clostridia bacterium]